MNTAIITYIVMALIAAGGWATAVAIAKGKSKTVKDGFATAEKVAAVADTVTDVAATVMPGPVTSTLQKITDAAKIGVNSAEQLYLNGSITIDQRKAEAEKVLKTALGLDGIAYEGDVASLGDSAMEAAVKALPKTSTEKAAKPATDAQVNPAAQPVQTA